MSELFGFPSGYSKGEEDIRAQQKHLLDLSKGQVELETAQIGLTSQKKMMELLSQSSMGGGAKNHQPIPGAPGAHTDQLAENLDELASMAMASGLPDQAGKYASAASTMRRNAAYIDKTATDNVIKSTNAMAGLLDNVHDPRSWQQANAMYQLQFGKPSPYANLPYNPQLVDQIKNGVASSKDRALTQAAQARAKASDAATAERKARIPLIRAQTELDQARTKALEKAGATGRIPKAGSIRSVTDLLVKDFGGGVPPEEARVLARPVAERMEDLMATGLSASVAANRAYQEAKAAGDFGGLRPRTQIAGTASRPLEIPADSKKLKPNMYYAGKGKYDGKTLLWTGETFLEVGSGPGQVQPEEDENADEGYEDDDGLPPDNPTADDNAPAQ